MQGTMIRRCAAGLQSPGGQPRPAWYCVALAIGLLLQPSTVSAQVQWWEEGLPIYDHVVIVVEENKGFDRIMGAEDAPFLQQLSRQGAVLTNIYGEEHRSQGNYFWLLSGSNEDVGFKNKVPPKPLERPSLPRALLDAGYTFSGYSEDLPAIGSQVVKHGNYARKHVPWISLADVPNGPTEATSCNLRWRDFPEKDRYDELPTVSVVIPNLNHDMHDGSVRAGDQWLRDNLGDYVRWATRHNSLLIVTFDEDSGLKKGLTDPRSLRASRRNHIATLFVGAHVVPGEYEIGAGVTHVNILRTLEAMYGLPRLGKQPETAHAAGIDEEPISDVFTRQATSYEVKFLLTEESLAVGMAGAEPIPARALKEALVLGRRKPQRSIWFIDDAERTLQRHGWIVRVRYPKDNGTEFTYKRRLPMGGRAASEAPSHFQGDETAPADAENQKVEIDWGEAGEALSASTSVALSTPPSSLDLVDHARTSRPKELHELPRGARPWGPIQTARWEGDLSAVPDAAGIEDVEVESWRLPATDGSCEWLTELSFKVKRQRAEPPGDFRARVSGLRDIVRQRIGPLIRTGGGSKTELALKRLSAAGPCPSLGATP